MIFKENANIYLKAGADQGLLESGFICIKGVSFADFVYIFFKDIQKRGAERGFKRALWTPSGSATERK